MKIIIQGDPVAKGRPKFARRGSFIATYTPAKTRKHEDIIRQAGIESMNGLEPLLVPLRVVIECFMPIPKSISKKDRQGMIDGTICHTKRPDLDNLAKVIDGLNGIVWKDDSQIVRLVVTKRYAENPRTEILIEQFIN
ncbi:MAG TPA: RusA family crossover junction endodeoxyribonuclease [Methanosarcina sp.]|nr:RusA family crossover junction endodeoxyribonuclease [Methanosarcina sp.]